MKVRAGSWYYYYADSYDRFDGRTGLKEGQRVQVRQVPGCPGANVMGHCYVYDAAGKFVGMVCTASLVKECKPPLLVLARTPIEAVKS